MLFIIEFMTCDAFIFLGRISLHYRPVFMFSLDLSQKCFQPIIIVSSQIKIFRCSMPKTDGVRMLGSAA